MKEKQLENSMPYDVELLHLVLNRGQAKIALARHGNVSIIYYFQAEKVLTFTKSFLREDELPTEIRDYNQPAPGGQSIMINGMAYNRDYYKYNLQEPRI